MECQSIKVEEIIKREKTLFCNTQSNGWFRQNISMNATTSGWKFDKEQDIYTVSKYFLSNDWLIIEEKIVTLQWRHWQTPPSLSNQNEHYQ